MSGAYIRPGYAKETPLGKDTNLRPDLLADERFNDRVAQKLNVELVAIGLVQASTSILEKQVLLEVHHLGEADPNEGRASLG